MKQSRVYTVAITGGIGSGKSIVSGMLKNQGFTVYSCDEINAQMLHSEDYIGKINQVFPQCVDNGEVDKRKLRQLIISDPMERKRLDMLSHGEISRRLEILINDSVNKGERLVFVEVPLLYETDMQADFDEVWLVTADTEMRAMRVVERDGVDYLSAYGMINSQMTDEEKISRFSPIVISNNGTVERLRDKIVVELMRLGERVELH